MNVKSLWEHLVPADQLLQWSLNTRRVFTIQPTGGNNFSPKLKGVNFLKDKKISYGLKHSIFSDPVAFAESARPCS